MIELNEVTVKAAGGRVLLQKVSLRLASGEKAVLLGANGSGKTTLLKLMNGLIDAAAGEVLWEGRPVSRQSLKQRDFSRAFRSRNVLLFQHPEAMLFNATVAEEIAYGPRRLGLQDVDDRVARCAAELGLGKMLALPPYELSGGEKQRLALATLLALDPDCLLLDEPAAHLDPRAVAWLVHWLAASPKAALVSTHDLSLAKELAKRCLVLAPDGRLLFDGVTADALADGNLLAAADLVYRGPDAAY